MSRITPKANDATAIPQGATRPPAATPAVGSIFRAELAPGSERFGAVQVHLDRGQNGAAPRIVDAVLPRNSTWAVLGGGSFVASRAGSPEGQTYEPHHRAAIVALTVGAMGSLLALRVFGARVGWLPAAYAAILAAAGLHQRYQFAQFMVVAAATGVAGANWMAARTNPGHAGPAHIWVTLLQQGLAVAAMRALFDAVGKGAPVAPTVDGLQFEPPLRVTYGSTDDAPATVVARLGSLRRMDSRGRLAAEGSVDVRLGGATFTLDAVYLNALARLAQMPWLSVALPSAWADAAEHVRTFGILLTPEAQQRALESGSVAPKGPARPRLSLPLLRDELSAYLSATFAGVKLQGNASITPVRATSTKGASAQAEHAPEAAAAADLAARTAFNVLLDRSRVTATFQLHPGTHTAAGLGIEAGYTPRIAVQPGTTATLKTGRIDQVPGTAPTQGSLFARLGAAIGAVVAAMWNALCWLFGRGTATAAATPVTPVSLAPTSPNAPLYAHGAEFTLNKPVDVRLSNWTQNILSARLNGAHLDEVGGLKPKGNVRLFGVPVLSLERDWVRNALVKGGVQLSTDPFRILYEAEIFAEPKLAPNEKPVVPVVDAERSAAAQGLLGKMVGAIDATVEREAIAAPRLELDRSLGSQTEQGPEPEAFQLKLFATAEPVHLHYNLHQFQQPIELRVRELTLDATVQRRGAAAPSKPLRIHLPEAVARGFWANPLDPTHWQSASVPQLRLEGGSGAKAVPLVQLRDAAWQQDTVTHGFYADLDAPPQGRRELAAWLNGLESENVTPSVVRTLGLLGSVHYGQTLPRKLAQVAFVPGPPTAGPSAPVPPASAAGDADDLEGSTLAGTPPRSRAGSVAQGQTLGRSGGAHWSSSNATLVELED